MQLYQIIVPLGMQQYFWKSSFQTYFTSSYLERFLWVKLVFSEYQKQQAITWANVGPALCLHMASYGQHDLIMNQMPDGTV